MVMTFMVVTYELQRPLRNEQLRSLGEFANTYGLQRFHLDADGRHLRFEYDASRLKESVVESVLRAAKIAIIRKVTGAAPIAPPPVPATTPAAPPPSIGAATPPAVPPPSAA
jgi:hypothetical protein